ncbi:MAG: signal peptide peptidase SppA, partial [Caulobacteraceae bacterium]
EARARGLVDRIGDPREMTTAIKQRGGRDVRLIDFRDYAASLRGPRPGRGAAIAVIDAEGPIITGTVENGAVFGGSQSIYGDDVAKAIYDAAEDKDIKAIVLRLSSPGGNPAASEQILQAVRAAKAANKPVVVSMGTYAASGGYWVASEASSIVAEPSTLTGSIGVFTGKFALGDALGKFGVDVRQTAVGGDYATSFSMAKGFTPEQRAKLARSADTIYADFITRVARGRNLKPERVREIAHGRVWTGAQARALGLVDELGGFYQAVERAKALAGLKGDVRLKHMRQELSPFEAIQRAFGASTESARVTAAAAWILGDPRAKAVMDHLAEARMSSQGPQLLSARPGF